MRFSIPFPLNCQKCNKFYDKNKRLYVVKFVEKKKFETYFFKFICVGCKTEIIIRTCLQKSEYLPYYNCIERKEDYKIIQQKFIFDKKLQFSSKKKKIEKLLLKFEDL